MAKTPFDISKLGLSFARSLLSLSSPGSRPRTERVDVLGHFPDFSIDIASPVTSRELAVTPTYECEAGAGAYPARRHWVNRLGYRSARRPTTCRPDYFTLSLFNLTHPGARVASLPTPASSFPVSPLRVPLRSRPTPPPSNPYHLSSSPHFLHLQILLLPCFSFRERRYSTLSEFPCVLFRAFPDGKRVYRFI